MAVKYEKERVGTVVENTMLSFDALKMRTNFLLSEKSMKNPEKYVHNNFLVKKAT